MGRPQKVVAVGALVALLVAVSAWVSAPAPMTAQQVSGRIAQLQAEQLEIRNDAVRDWLRCQEWGASAGADVRRSCLAAAKDMAEMNKAELADLQRQIAELRAYVPR